MHGGNLGKNPLFTNDTSGPLCCGADSKYHIISLRECSHRTMQACRQKHIALLDIRKREIRKKRHFISYAHVRSSRRRGLVLLRLLCFARSYYG